MNSCFRIGIDCSRLFSDQPTGVEHYTNHVVLGVLQRFGKNYFSGLEVRCYVRTAIQAQQLQEWLRKQSFHHIRVYHLSFPRLWSLIRLSWEMLVKPVDLLFVPSHVLPLFPAKRMVLTVHGVEMLLFPQAYTFWQRLSTRINIRIAQRTFTDFIAVSHVVSRFIADRYQVTPSKIHTVYNGFNFPPTLSLSLPTVYANQLMHKQFIVCVGRIEARKNQLRLIKAFKSIADDFPLLKLVLIGPDGYQASEVYNFLEHDSIKSRVVFTGHLSQEEVYAFIRHALVLAYPSLAEGFGIPILEGFALKTPVLTSKGENSACKEIAESAAVFCDPQSVKSIATALRSLITTPTLRRQKVSDGWKRLQYFSWDECSEQTFQVLKSIYKDVS